MASEDDNALSTEGMQVCECCDKLKLCRLYVLQDLRAAWVCVECRGGKHGRTS